MAILMDTGPLYALADRDDDYHQVVSQFINTNRELLVIPVTVLPECCYLLRKFLGFGAEQSVVESVSRGEMRLENLSRADMIRVGEVLFQYGSSGVDFVDASIVAIAERLAITRLLTVDRMHFTMIRPRHCDAFQLLPE